MREVAEIKFLWKPRPSYDSELGGNVTVWDHPDAETAMIKGHTEKWLFSDIVLMQSTGCKDKNGSEVFEHDLIKYKDETSVVLFRHGAFVAVDELGTWILLEPHLTQDGAVKIGNIWDVEDVKHKEKLLSMIAKTVGELNV